MTGRVSISNLPFEGTDCALPMIWARENEVNVSAFITYTDSETWAGKIHPSQALRQYRNEFVGDAKAVVVGMTSNGFTIADPNDRGMLDVVGFDTTQSLRTLFDLTIERFKDAKERQSGRRRKTSARQFVSSVRLEENRNLFQHALCWISAHLTTFICAADF
jgi:hypothetical protein